MIHKKSLNLILADQDIPWTHYQIRRNHSQFQNHMDAITKRANLAYPVLHRLIPLISRNSKLKTNLNLNLYKMCVRSIIIYGYQIWASATNTHTNKKSRTSSYTSFWTNHTILPLKQYTQQQTNIQTIKEYIQNSLIKSYNNSHPNSFIRNTANYETTNIPLKIKIKLLKHAITKQNNNTLVLHITIALKYSRLF